MNAKEYLKVLEMRLRRRLPEELVAERLKEMDVHLQMAIDAAGELEMSEESAVRAMDAPEVLADALIRQSSGASVQSHWRLMRWLGPCLFLCLGIPYASFTLVVRYPLLLDSIAEAMRIGVWLWMFALFAHVVRNRRWIVIGAVPWALLCSVVAMAGATFFLPGNPPNPADRARALTDVRNGLKQLESEAALLRRWETGEQNLPQGIVADETTSNVRMVPLVPFGIRSQVTSYKLQPVNPSESNATWRRFHEQFAAELQARQTSLQQTLSLLQNPAEPAYLAGGVKAYTSPVIFRLITQGLQFTLATLVVIAIQNGLFLWAVKLLDSQRNRRYQKRFAK